MKMAELQIWRNLNKAGNFKSKASKFGKGQMMLDIETVELLRSYIFFQMVCVYEIHH